MTPNCFFFPGPSPAVHRPDRGALHLRQQRQDGPRGDLRDVLALQGLHGLVLGRQRPPPLLPGGTAAEPEEERGKFKRGGEAEDPDGGF